MFEHINVAHMQGLCTENERMPQMLCVVQRSEYLFRCVFLLRDSLLRNAQCTYAI